MTPEKQAAVQHYPGKMITLEGLEGAGKSSVIPEIATLLRQQGKTVELTREPGGTQLAEKIRQLLLTEQLEETVDPVTETLLMWAARRQHWQQRVLPALQQGHWVICDRFIDSSIAYQQYGRGISADLLNMLHRETLQRFEPNLTLLFVIEPQQGFARITNSGKKLDRIEQEGNVFFQRVFQGYQQQAQKNPERIVLLDGNKARGEVVIDTLKAVTDFIARSVSQP